MNTCTAAIAWTRAGAEFKTSPARFMTTPASHRLDVSPEAAFIAALSSGHMQSFLRLADLFGYVIEHYGDTPEGIIATNSAGDPWVAHVILQPAILFTGAKAPTEADVLALHDAAHAVCALANSVTTLVETAGVWHHETYVAAD